MNAAPIFKQIDAPVKHRKFSSDNDGRWFTWSDGFQVFIPEVRKASRKYGAPPFVHYSKYKVYNYTYSVVLGELDEGFVKESAYFAGSLSRFRIGKGLNFFDRLLGRQLDGETFHFLIALLRAQLAALRKDEMGSLYAPLTVTKTEDDFPLHCDLYIPENLWNVFEDTAPGKQGASTFLPVKTLLYDLMDKVPGIPAGKKTRLKELITVENYRDRYDALFSLLYDDRYAWSGELKKLMHDSCLQIKFQRGQGYMIHDRSWMHGRSRTFGHVSSKRLHRLIF